MEKGRRLVVLLAVAALALPAHAQAVGGRYAFDGGTPHQRAQVRLALEASAFDFGLLPPVVVHIARGATARAYPGSVWLDARLLDAGVFSWAVVQDEFAHQVDYFLLDRDARHVFARELGAAAWCYGDAPDLHHSQYGCERFTSTFVWAYWPHRANAYRPRGTGDESAAMEPRRFRLLLEAMIGVPRFAAVEPPAATISYRAGVAQLVERRLPKP